MSKARFPDPIRELPVFEGPLDACQLNAGGCEALYAPSPAGTSIEPHTHPRRNVGVITEGEPLLAIGGIESRCGPGDWYRIEPNEEHSARFDVDTSEIELWFMA